MIPAILGSVRNLRRGGVLAVCSGLNDCVLGTRTTCALCFNHFLFQPQKTFEMKVNISGTELVVLENIKTVDTHAVVLKVYY